MKKVTYALLTISLFAISSEINSTPLSKNATIEVVSPEITVTDIYTFLSTKLGLTATQKPAVKTAVDEAGAEITKLNTSTTKTSTEISAAKTSIVNSLIKKLGSEVLNSTQSTKLTSLTGELTSMFSQLK